MFEDETTPKADAATKFFAKKKYFFCKIILICLVETEKKYLPIVKMDIFEEKI